MGQCSSALRSPRSSNPPSEPGAPTAGPSGTQNGQEPQTRDLRRRRSTDISHDNKRPRAHINQQGTDIPADDAVDDEEAAAGPSAAQPEGGEPLPQSPARSPALSPVQSPALSPTLSPVEPPVGPSDDSPAYPVRPTVRPIFPPHRPALRENPPLFGPGTDHPHFDLPNISSDAPNSPMQPESRTEVQVATLSRMLYIAGLYTATTMVQGRFRSGELYAGSNGVAERRQRNQQEVVNRLRERMLDDNSARGPDAGGNESEAAPAAPSAATDDSTATSDSGSNGNDSNGNDSSDSTASSDANADNDHMHVNLLRFLSQLRNGGHSTELSRLISEPDQIDNFFRLFRFPDDDGRTPVLLMGIRAVETRQEEPSPDAEPAHPGAMQIPTVHVPLHPPPPPPGQPETAEHAAQSQPQPSPQPQPQPEVERSGQAPDQPAAREPERSAAESADGLNFTNSEDNSTASVAHAEEQARRIANRFQQVSRLMSLVSNMAENDDDESEEETDQPLHTSDMTDFLEPSSAEALASMALNAIIESQLQQSLARRPTDPAEAAGNGAPRPDAAGASGAAASGPTEPSDAAPVGAGPGPRGPGGPADRAGPGGPEGPGDRAGPGGPGGPADRAGPGGPGGPGMGGGPGLLTDPERRISWMVYVLGGLYSSTHPVFTRIGQPDSPIYNDAQLVEWLLGVQKPLVARKEDVERSGGLSEVAEGDQLLSERCPVCLVDYDVGDECRTLHCGHLFHKTCVDEWLTKSHNSCPMCRQEGVTTRPGEAMAQ